jgi:S-adenosylmethionine synthetase
MAVQLLMVEGHFPVKIQQRLIDLRHTQQDGSQKNIVAADLAEKCTIQLSYAIGVAKPLSVYVNTYGTGNVSEQKISEYLENNLDLSPRGIREQLGLNRPIYARTSAYGHFGREPENDGGFSWEKLDLLDQLKNVR